MRQQEEALKNFRDPFKQEDGRGARTSMQAPGNLQSSGSGNGASASMQAAGMQSDSQAASKNLGKQG
jgi:hypothetical protein